MLAGRQPLAHFTRHRDVVTINALSFTNGDFEIERDALANAPDLDHGDLSVVEPPETGGTVVPVAKATWFWKATATRRDKTWKLSQPKPKMEPSITMATGLR